MNQIRISAKVLGELTLSNFCPRCFWIKMHCKGLPFQIFPGIFSSIDSYCKKMIDLHYDQHERLPDWFAQNNIFGKPLPIPHHSQFNVLDKDINILLTGSPDGIFLQSDKSHIIIDYKTARFTPYQDYLLPMYNIQLNAYAYIGEYVGYSPVKKLYLVYYEPNTNILNDDLDSLVYKNGFSLKFSGNIHKINIETKKIKSLLSQVREIYDKTKTPEGLLNCKNCILLDELFKIIH